jgi:hypothetical protein
MSPSGGHTKGSKMTATLAPDLSFEEKLRNRSENTQHLDFQVGDLSFNAGKRPSVSIAGEDYFLTDGSFRQIAEEMKIPVPYARRIPDDLLSYTVNYFINNNRSNHIAALSEDGHIRSFMKTNTPYVSNTEMFDAVLEATGSDYDLRYAKMSDTITSFSILPSNYRESVDGSNLFGGVKVVFSDAWDRHPSIDSYIWRELCSNGMINELESRKFRVAGSSHDDVLRQIRDFSVIAIEKLPELFDNFNKLLEEEVKDYVKIIRQIVLEYKLPNKVQTRLLFWAVNPDFLATISNDKIENMHDIVNLVTYVGSHDGELSQEIRERLLQIGGNLTLNHHDRCNSCGSSF